MYQKNHLIVEDRIIITVMLVQTTEIGGCGSGSMNSSNTAGTSKMSSANCSSQQILEH